MADEQKSQQKAGGAAQRPDMTDTSKAQHGHTKKTEAGQEATRGIPTDDHTREHQSNYGGGGAHGGASGAGKDHP